MQLSRPVALAAGGVVLGVAAAGVRNLSKRADVPEHSETHLSVSCADGRYAQARAFEALRMRPHLWGPEPRTVFPQTPPGGGAAVLHPTFGPAIIAAIDLLRSVHAFELVELRLHVGGPGGCGYLNAMAVAGDPLWLGEPGRTASGGSPEQDHWHAHDVGSPEGVLRIGERARDVVLANVADASLDVRVRVDQFGHNLAGLPTVRTVVAA